jgi:anthranilate phosphoribosyltransferase
MIAGLAVDIPAGIDMATDSIDSGKARAALETLIEVSNG